MTIETAGVQRPCSARVLALTQPLSQFTVDSEPDAGSIPAAASLRAIAWWRRTTPTPRYPNISREEP
jgi:hypothetical protein